MVLGIVKCCFRELTSWKITFGLVRSVELRRLIANLSSDDSVSPSEVLWTVSGYNYLFDLPKSEADPDRELHAVIEGGQNFKREIDKGRSAPLY